MHLRGDKPLFFATDLTNFLACRHLMALERLAAHKIAKRPFFDDPMLEILRERGLEHERAYVQRLAQSGMRVVEIDRASPSAFEETLSAMRDGADVVVQARLEHGAWAGWADVLLRVDGKSRFGPWRYEPVETKLAKETRGATLIQLCLYADLLAELQEAPPALLRVVVPDRNFEPECYRFDEFRAYFRLVRRNFEAEIAKPLSASVEAAVPYPEPVAHCEICNWYSVCDKRWTQDDHVSLVAGIRKAQRKELANWGVTTLAALAQVPLPLPRRPQRGSVAAFERVREQARLQLEARTSGKPAYELLPVEEEHGLAALPAPSPLDIFLDLEGDRQAENGGLDYLFGYVLRDAEGVLNYEALWALSPTEEKRAFERLIDLIVERRRRDPAMHVYHYAPYEPTAMKRLMGRYGTRADELDQLLRAKVFVDLYSVVRKGLRAGVDSYSIKKLEPFYGLAREVDLRQASRHLRAVEYAIARRDAASLTAEIREAVRSYNRDDCFSALGLRDWLERLRLEAERNRGEPIPRPAPPLSKPNEKLEDRLARIRAVSEALTAQLPVDRNRAQEAQWILAQLLEWHRREDKVDWWEFFRLNEMAEDELLDERAGIAGLQFERRLETTKRGVVVDRYQFPPQDTDFDEGDDGFEPGCEKPSSVAKVEAIDLEHRTIDLRKGVARADHHPTALFKQDKVSNPDAVNALLRLGEFVRDHGIDAPRFPPGCARPPAPAEPPARRWGDAAQTRGIDRGLRASGRPHPRWRCPRHPGTTRLRQDVHGRADDRRPRSRGEEGRRHRGQPQGDPEPLGRGCQGGRRRECSRSLHASCQRQVEDAERGDRRGDRPRKGCREDPEPRVRRRWRDRVGLVERGPRRSHRRPRRRRGGADVARERARLRSGREEPRASRGSAAARAAAEGKSPRGLGTLGSRIPPGGPRHDAGRTGALPGGDLAPSSVDLQLHLGAVLRGKAWPTSQPGRTGRVRPDPLRWDRPFLRSRCARGEPEQLTRGSRARRGDREEPRHGGRHLDEPSW